MGRRTRTAIALVSGMLAIAATFAVTTTPAAAQTSTTGAATTLAADQYCAVSFTVNQWPGAAIVNVSIQNISTVTVRWTLLTMTFPGPVPTGSFWNVNISVAGSVMTIVPTSWSPVPNPSTGVLAPGQSVQIGYLFYTGSGTLPLPTAQVTCMPV